MTDSPTAVPATDSVAGPHAIGVDVGGSGVKAAVVDTGTGLLVSERLRVPTPTPSTPEKVGATIGRLVRRLVKSEGHRRPTSRSASGCRASPWTGG